MLDMNGVVEADEVSLVGVTTSNDDVKLAAGGNLTLEAASVLGEGDLFLDVDGDVSQIAAGTINAAGLGLQVDGETILNESNDIEVLAANNNGATQFTDINDLKVGTVTIEAVSADRAMLDMNGVIEADEVLLVGVTTSDDDVNLTAGGNLTLEQQVTLGTGDLFLDVDGGVTQLEVDVDEDGTIQAAGLGLMVEGATILNNIGNDVDVIAAGNGGNQGAIQFVDVDDLAVGQVTVAGVTLTGVEIDSQGIVLDEVSFTDQIDVLNGTTQTQTLNDELIFNPSFEGYLQGLSVTNDGVASNVGLALLSGGELQVNQGVSAASDVFLTTTADDITVNQDIATNDLADRILIVGADELNLNAELSRGTEGRVISVSNLNGELIILNPQNAGDTFALTDLNDQNQNFEFTFGQPGEQGFTTTVFFGVSLDSYISSGLLPDFDVLDFVVPETSASLTEVLFAGGVEDFESRSVFFDSAGGQTSIVNQSQPINGANDLLPPSPANPIATASFTLDFLNTNPEFRNVAFVFNDAGINIFDNAVTADGVRDLNVAVEDFIGLANIGTSPVITVERPEFETPEQVEFISVAEPDFFQSTVVAEQPLFTQTVQEKFFVVVYFENQAEADDFEFVFEQLETSETGEKDFDQLREILKRFDSLDFKTDDASEALDANKIRQIFEKADLNLGEDDEQWREAFLEWLKEKELNDESPEVPRGVFKIIEVENGKAVIQGDDIDRRFVPEPGNKGAQDYPFDIPSNDVNPPDLEDPLRLTPPVDGQNEGASTQPTSGRLSRWAAMLAGKTAIADQTVDDTSLLSDNSATIAATSSAMGLLGLVLQRNATRNRTASDEIEDFAKLKSESPKRNIFSKAARFGRRNKQALREENQN